MFENGTFIVVWQGNGNGDPRGVFRRLFNSDGKPLGGEVCLNEVANGQQLSPRVASNWNGQHAVVVWHGVDPKGEKGVFAKLLPTTK